jgi:hypothetical protein
MTFKKEKTTDDQFDSELESEEPETDTFKSQELAIDNISNGSLNLYNLILKKATDQFDEHEITIQEASNLIRGITIGLRNIAAVNDMIYLRHNKIDGNSARDNPVICLPQVMQEGVPILNHGTINKTISAKQMLKSRIEINKEKVKKNIAKRNGNA